LSAEALGLLNTLREAVSDLAKPPRSRSPAAAAGGGPAGGSR
jgi:hypothetical protein